MAAAQAQCSYDLLIKSLLSTDQTVRHSAEMALRESQKSDKEFAAKMCSFVTDVSADGSVRQLAAVLLKQHIVTNWTNPLMIGDQVKEYVRAGLLTNLSDKTRAMRVASAYALAAIGQLEWPLIWPTFIDDLDNQVHDSTSAHGALLALAEFVPHVATDQTAKQLLQRLMPSLLSLLNPESVGRSIVVFLGYRHSLSIQRRSLDIIGLLIKLVADCNSQDRSSLKDQLTMYVPQISSRAVPLIGHKCVTLTVAATTVVHSLIEVLPSVVYDSCGQTLVAVVVQNLRAVAMRGNTSNHEVVLEEFEDTELEESCMVACDLCELAQSLSCLEQYNHLIVTHLPVMFDAAVHLMRIDVEKETSWLSSVDTFVGEEDEDALGDDARSSAKELILTLCEQFKGASSSILCEVVRTRFVESANMRAHKQTDWWRASEASVSALAVACDSLLQYCGSQMIELITEHVFVCLEAADYPILRAQSLWLLSRCVPSMNTDWKQKLLHVCAMFLSDEKQLFLRVCAVRALYNALCGLADPQDVPLVTPHVGTFVHGVVSVAINGAEPLVNLSLSTLLLLVEINTAAAAPFEQRIVPLANACALRYSGDAVIPSTSCDIIQCMSSQSTCRPKIQQRLVPTVLGVLKRPDNDAGMPLRMPAVVVDLLTAFISALPPEETPPTVLISDVLPTLTHRLLVSQDVDLLIAGCICLRLYVKQWFSCVNGEQALNMVQIICHIMTNNDKLNAISSVNSVTIQLLYTLLKYMAASITNHLQHVIVTSVTLMMGENTAESLRALCHTCICYLLMYKSEATVHCLMELPVQSGTHSNTGLQIICANWSNTHDQLISDHQQRISILALCQLLQCIMALRQDTVASLFDMNGDNRRPFVDSALMVILRYLLRLIKMDLSTNTITCDNDINARDNNDNSLHGLLADVAAECALDVSMDIEDDDWMQIDMKVHLTQYLQSMAAEHTSIRTYLGHADITAEERQMLDSVIT